MLLILFLVLIKVLTLTAESIKFLILTLVSKGAFSSKESSLEIALVVSPSSSFDALLKHLIDSLSLETASTAFFVLVFLFGYTLFLKLLRMRL